MLSSSAPGWGHTDGDVERLHNGPIFASARLDAGAPVGINEVHKVIT
jgi:hypothetical protein